MGRPGGELARRVGVALVGIPIAVALTYLGGYWLAAFLGALASMAAWEFFAMHRNRGVPSFRRTGALLALVFVLLAATRIDDFPTWATLLAIALITPAVLRAAPDSSPGLAGAVTVFGALYTGGMVAFAVWLRALEGTVPGWRGVGVLFFPVALTWLGDTAAYFVGRSVGRHPLAPTISPAKTWEGSIAGVATAIVGALVYVEVTRPIVAWTIPAAAVLGFGGLVALAGQAGDLVESRFKRECGVKDSSDLLPGHGGFLDRLDSLLFVFPVSYTYLKAVGF